MKIRLTKRDERLIKELQNGAYFLSDGANVSLHGSKVTANARMFRRFLNIGCLIDVPHQSKVFDERKYTIIPDFDFKKELRKETKKYLESLGK